MSKYKKKKSTGHTSGPWEEGRPDMATVVDGVESKWIYAGKKYLAIASGADVNNWQEVMANARLIAAAPDLFNLIKQVMPMEMGGYPDLFYPTQGWKKWEKKVLRVIAKIEGE